MMLTGYGDFETESTKPTSHLSPLASVPPSSDESHFDEITTLQDVWHKETTPKDSDWTSSHFTPPITTPSTGVNTKNGLTTTLSSAATDDHSPSIIADDNTDESAHLTPTHYIPPGPEEKVQSFGVGTTDLGPESKKQEDGLKAGGPPHTSEAPLGDTTVQKDAIFPLPTKIVAGGPGANQSGIRPLLRLGNDSLNHSTTAFIATPNTRAIVEKPLWVYILVGFILFFVTIGIVLFVVRRQLIAKLAAANSAARTDTSNVAKKSGGGLKSLKLSLKKRGTDPSIKGLAEPTAQTINLSNYEFYFCYDQPYEEFHEYLGPSRHPGKHSPVPKHPPTTVQRKSGKKFKLFDDIVHSPLPAETNLSDVNKKSDGEKTAVKQNGDGIAKGGSPASENDGESPEEEGEISPLISGGNRSKSPDTPEPSKKPFAKKP